MDLQRADKITTKTPNTTRQCVNLMGNSVESADVIMQTIGKVTEETVLTDQYCLRDKVHGA